MAASIMQVARTLGSLSGWSLSNLELQKMAYISEMLHLGRFGVPLIDEEWQAWDYGPVQPDLYHKVKAYGNSPVRDVFTMPSLVEGTSEHNSVRETHNLMRSMRPGQMVNVTHQAGGAWANNYQTGLRGVRIPKEQIRAEYATLINDSHESAPNV